MTFQREERIAFARIISDLIEADFIVEQDEMRSFDKIRNDRNFKISMEMLSEAKTKSFADAVSTLQRIKEPEKRQLIKDKLFEMSLSDGTCVPLEALQIMAATYALDNRGQVLSIPIFKNAIADMTVLYIENEDNTATNRFIKSHYRSLSNEFALIGFNFVYIPQIVSDYSLIKGEYLHKVISYMLPLVTESKIERIQDDLCSMTTSRFTHELLFKKLGLNLLNSRPAFLIKIGESSVADKCGADDMERTLYSNFLLVPLDDSSDTVTELVEHLTDTYKSMINERMIIERRPLSNKFLYYGFHRFLFDLIAYGKEKQDYKLIINLKDRTNPVLLRPFSDNGEEDLSIELNTQPYTLYILTVLMSIDGRGLDWKDYHGKSPVKEELLRKYNSIYKTIGRGRTIAEYRGKTNMSRIRRSLLSLGSVVSNIELFVPEKVSDGDSLFYRVPLPPDMIYVVEHEQEVNIMDSQLWSSF